MKKENNKIGQKSKAGRKPKAHPAIYRYDIRLNEMDSCKFETMFELSGFKYRGHFIKDKVLKSSLKVIEIDKTIGDYVIKLSQTRSQMRGVGNNYNQVLRLLKEQLGERKALRYLYKLEQAMIELVRVYKELEQQLQNLETKWLQK